MKKYYSEIQYYTQTSVSDKGRVEVVNEDGHKIALSQKYVEDCLVSADGYSKEEKMTRTQLAEKFIASTRMVMTVCYNKQVKQADIKDKLASLDGVSSVAFKKEIAKLSKTLLDGEERIMIGRHYGHLNDFGRIDFIDMEAEKGSGAFDGRLRQVDPRTINWLIVDGVKYVQK